MNSRMTAGRILVLVLIVANVISAGCFESGSSEKDRTPIEWKDDSEATPEGVEAVVHANNQFAFELIDVLNSNHSGENLFFSPYSIMVCMAMVYEGTRGQTAAEMQNVFHYPVDDIMRRSSFARLHNQINEDRDDYELSTANALWAQEDYRFLSEYLNVTDQYYDAKANNVDFIGETEATRQMINAWVEERTNEKIVELIESGQISTMTRLVLTNAIYFKGNWLNEFDEDDTRDGKFKVDSNTNVTVPFMAMRDQKHQYTSMHGFEVLELPYKGDELSMLILLPWNDSADPLDLALDEMKLAEIREGLHEREVDIDIPKFEFETKYDLKEYLMMMGMPSAFTPDVANLSGMDGSNDLFLKFVVHQAYVKVDEKGTEAAAATAAGGDTLCISPYYDANHPFLFIIQQRDNGNILFMGKVTDPSTGIEG